MAECSSRHNETRKSMDYQMINDPYELPKNKRSMDADVWPGIRVSGQADVSLKDPVRLTDDQNLQHKQNLRHAVYARFFKMQEHLLKTELRQQFITGAQRFRAECSFKQRPDLSAIDRVRIKTIYYNKTYKVFVLPAFPKGSTLSETHCAEMLLLPEKHTLRLQ
ncbi:hypothetical protein ABVT39_000658 [Epinephelus coioides]